MQPLLTLFDMDERGYTPMLWRLRIISRSMFIIYPLLLLFFYGSAVFALWVAWVQGGDYWGEFWRTLYTCLLPTLLILRIAASYEDIPAWRLRGAFIALRRAALVGDEALAPLARTQPARATVTAPESSALAKVDRVGPLVRLNATVERLTWFVAFAFGLTLGPGLLALVAWMFSLPTSFAIGSLTTLGAWQSLELVLPLATVGLMAVGLLIMGLFGLWRTYRFSPDLAVQVDDQSIGWRRRPWDRTLTIRRWSEARAFYMISYKGGRHWTTRTVYALDFGAAILTWEVVAISNRYASAKAQARERATREVSQRLCDEIARHTNLPLRDVTALAQGIVATLSPGAASGAHPLASALLPYTDPEGRLSDALGLATPAATSRAWRVGCVTICAGLGVLVGLATVGAALQLRLL